MNQTIILLTLALTGTLALVAMALLAVRVAVIPPTGTNPTAAQRIELYGASVAMLTALGLAWTSHAVPPERTSPRSVAAGSPS